MAKYMKVVLIIIFCSSFFGGAYAFTSIEINPELRDYMILGMIPICAISFVMLGIVVIMEDIKNSKCKNNLNQDINNSEGL
jgi:hypothetical protein